MTQLETGQLMDLFTAAYPRYYASQSESECNAAIGLWYEMLKDYPLSLVKAAAKSLIAVQKFPPAVSEVIEKIRLITTPCQLDEGKAWAIVQEAITNAGYHAQEEFERLPPLVQNAVGSPNVLRQWAFVEIDDLETVVRSNFVRSYRAGVKTRNDYESLPPDIQDFIKKIGGPVVQGIGENRQRRANALEQVSGAENSHRRDQI